MWGGVNQLSAPAGTADIGSLAVLPFTDLSESPDHEILVQGIHDALNAELSEVIPVISVRSVTRLRGTELSSPEIGARLGVDGLVSGRIRAVGPVLQISVELVEAETDLSLWSEVYERDRGDLLTLQREVTRDIARAIDVTLTRRQRTRLADTTEVDPRAFELYYRGREAWNRRSEEGFLQAVEFFERALDVDPTYAPAYAGLSDAYNLLGQYRHLPWEEARTEARRAAERAIALDSTLAAAYTALGETHFLAREWAEARQMYEKALELNPNYAIGHHFFGWFLTHRGAHERAIGELRRARELDPLSAIVAADLAGAYLNARRWFAARGPLDPQSEHGRFMLFASRLFRGTLDRAFPEGAEPTRFTDPLLQAYVLTSLGHIARADSIVRSRVGELEEGAPVMAGAAVWVAVIRLQQGRLEDGLDWLERAVDAGIAAGPFSFYGPFFDPVRATPRFRRLMERMGLPPRPVGETGIRSSEPGPPSGG